MNDNVILVFLVLPTDFELSTLHGVSSSWLHICIYFIIVLDALKPYRELKRNSF